MGVYTGAARIERVDRISKAVLVDSARETQAGDLLFSDDVQATADFIPHAPAKRVDGRIISVVDGVLLIGQYQVVAINRGKSHGIEPGHVLAIDDAGDKVRVPCQRSWSEWCVGGNKVRLPDERVGTLLRVQGLRPDELRPHRQRGVAGRDRRSGAQPVGPLGAAQSARSAHKGPPRAGPLL